MHKFEIEQKLQRNLKKIFKKDKKQYKIIFRKIEEVVHALDINHYKNLRAPLNEYKRVHIDKSFVLIFKYQKIDALPRLKSCGLIGARFLDARSVPHTKVCGFQTLRHDKANDKVIFYDLDHHDKIYK